MSSPKAGREEQLLSESVAEYMTGGEMTNKKFTNLISLVSTGVICCYLAHQASSNWQENRNLAELLLLTVTVLHFHSVLGFLSIHFYSIGAFAIETVCLLSGHQDRAMLFIPAVFVW